MVALLFACWALLVALSAAWLWLRGLRPAAAAGPAADPYAGEIARFRREVHDWDRNG
jgi:hypothetical protein